MKTTLKVVSKKTAEQENDHLDKVSLEELRRIWNDNLHNYTDEELIKLREWLYIVAQMVMSVTKRTEQENSKQSKIISLPDYEKEKSNPIYQGEHRRAS
jgi:hypothetical protein